MEYDEFRAMNSDIVLAAEGDDRELASGFERAREFIIAQEQRLTRFSDQSELMRLNESSGDWFPASGGLIELVGESIRMHAETGGLFNPAILPALKRAGYDRSFDQLPPLQSPENHPGPGGVVPGLVGIEIDYIRQRIRLPSGMQIDLGGIAKGWIAERAARLLAVHATACAVSAGGDMFLIGRPSEEPFWRLTVEDPLDARRALAVLRVGSETAIATSSVTRRRWMQDGKPRHHLIDPRTGEPARSDWRSVTVIADRMTRAEALAKALLIDQGRTSGRMIDREPAAIFIAVDEHGSLWGSPGSKELLDVYTESELETGQLAAID
jgi:thiamine biosynthesis lipoprotein